MPTVVAMSRSTTLGYWLRRFLSEHIVTERSLARNTQLGYRDTFTLLLPFVAMKARKLVDRLQLDDLTARRVLQFLDHLEEERGCTPQTRNQRLTAIRAFAKYVASRDPARVEWSGHIRAITQKKATPKPINWLDRDEMEALLKVPDRRTPRGRIEHALILFLYNSGARVSEAAGLVVKDLQIERRDGRHALVSICGKGGKHRQCPLWPRTERALAELLRGRSPDDAVFLSRQNRPYTRSGIYRLVERCAGKVPALSGRRITPHSVRHSTACTLLQARVDLNTIRAWLGHAKLDTTNIYAEIDLERKVKAMELCDASEPGPTRPWKENKGLMAFLDTL